MVGVQVEVAVFVQVEVEGGVGVMDAV